MDNYPICPPCAELCQACDFDVHEACTGCKGCGCVISAQVTAAAGPVLPTPR